MKKPQSRLPATVLGLSLSLFTTSFVYTPAEAIMMTLEPDDYAVGTNVTNLFEGVTINRYSLGYGDSSPYLSPVYVEEWPATGEWAAVTGTHTLGRFWDAPAGAHCFTAVTCHETFSVMLVEFASPTNYFEIASSYLTDYTLLYAFGTNGESLSTLQTSRTTIRYDNTYGGADTVQIGSLGGPPLIQSVIFAEYSASANMDTIRFNAVGVPEPSVLLLLGSGLAIAAVWRRRTVAALQKQELP